MEKENEEVPFYPFGTGKRTGVRLTDFHKELLTLVARFDFLTFDQMFEFYRYYEENKSVDGFRNKRGMWTNYKLLNGYLYKLGQSGTKFRYYTIGKPAIERILVPEGYLEESWNNAIIKPPKEDSKQLPHHFATRDVLIRTILATKRHNMEDEVEYLKAEEYPYCDQNVNPLAYENSLEIPTLVKPDYIIKKGDIHINLETDGKTEVHAKLQSKIPGYAEYCKQHPEQQHIVIFTVLDHTAKSNKELPEGFVRMGNMKKGLMLLKELGIPNLSVYVVPLRRAHIITENILLGKRPYGDSKEINTEIAVELLDKHNAQFDYNFEQLDNNDLYLPQVPDFCHADLAYKISNRSGSNSKNVLFSLLDEGNVADLARLDELNRLISKREFKNNMKIDKVIAIHPSIEERESDIIAMHLEHVLFTDTESLSDQVLQEPVFYRTKSEYVMEETTFEGK